MWLKGGGWWSGSRLVFGHGLLQTEEQNYLMKKKIVSKFG